MNTRDDLGLSKIFNRDKEIANAKFFGGFDDVDDTAHRVKGAV